MFKRKKHKYERMSETELLNCYFIEEDELAFGALYKRYQNKLQQFFKCKLSNSKRSQLDDLIQQTYFNIIKSKAFKHNEIRQFEDYLMTTAYNTFNQFYSQAQKENSIMKPLINVNRNTVESDNSIFEEQVIFLKKAIRQLSSPNQRAAIEGRLAGKRNKEIACEMQVNVKRVEDYIHRAKVNLKKIAN